MVQSRAGTSVVSPARQLVGGAVNLGPDVVVELDPVAALAREVLRNRGRCHVEQAGCLLLGAALADEGGGECRTDGRQQVPDDLLAGEFDHIPKIYTGGAHKGCFTIVNDP